MGYIKTGEDGVVQGDPVAASQSAPDAEPASAESAVGVEDDVDVDVEAAPVKGTWISSDGNV